jgi:hypothetical protein
MLTTSIFCRAASAATLVLALANSSASADELKPLKVFAVTGAHEGSEVDYVAERKEKTTAYVFVAADQWARPVARYVKKLDDEIAAGIKGAEDAHVVVVWLSDDAAKGKDYLPNVQMSLRLARTDWTVFEGQKAGPDGWNVDIAAALTTVIVRGGKESARFSYKTVNETDVAEATKALRKE